MAINKQGTLSILYPDLEAEYKTMSPVTSHDLGLDVIVKKISEEPKEQQMILRVLEKMTSSAEVAGYRQDIFEDLLTLPEIREGLLDLVKQIDYLRDYGTWRKSSDDKPGLWDLLHRLEEINSYICCVESMKDTLADDRIKSKGLKDLREYVELLYQDAHFAEMKKDIAALKTDASAVQSVTIGINVNERFEAESLGLVSINAKPFKKSGVLNNFADAVASKDKINPTEEWNGDQHYDVVDASKMSEGLEMAQKTVEFMSVTSTLMLTTTAAGKGPGSTMAKIPEGDGSVNSTFYLSGVASKMVGHLVKKLKGTLASYTDVSIVTISKLIPELIYYIRFAEFIEKSLKNNMHFCKAIATSGDVKMEAKGFYNLKLAASHESGDDIVDNDLTFDASRKVFILTGANRGGKTTLTQAVGLLYALAQGGIYVPCTSLTFVPVDMIFTHFPADEDQTMDLGRLGEECVRFKEIYSESTADSLILLNESFSTTSFEEGYYIALDAVKAIGKKDVRTIYNTHMHKLAQTAPEECSGVTSIVMQSEEGKRCFKVIEMPPEGSSYAKDIASKYGVTYEMLTGDN